MTLTEKKFADLIGTILARKWHEQKRTGKPAINKSPPAREMADDSKAGEKHQEK